MIEFEITKTLGLELDPMQALRALLAMLVVFFFVIVFLLADELINGRDSRPICRWLARVRWRLRVWWGRLRR